MRHQNQVQEFYSEEFGKVRVIEIDGQAWFVGNDVAAILGYEKARNALAKHVDGDDALKWGVTDSLGRTQKTTVINESGLYSLILPRIWHTVQNRQHMAAVPEVRRQGVHEQQDVLRTRRRVCYTHLLDAERAVIPVRTACRCGNPADMRM